MENILQTWGNCVTYFKVSLSITKICRVIEYGGHVFWKLFCSSSLDQGFFPSHLFSSGLSLSLQNKLVNLIQVGTLLSWKFSFEVLELLYSRSWVTQGVGLERNLRTYKHINYRSGSKWRFTFPKELKGIKEWNRNFKPL